MSVCYSDSCVKFIQLMIGNGGEGGRNLLSKAEDCGIGPAIWAAFESGGISADSLGLVEDDAKRLLAKFKKDMAAHYALWRMSAKYAIDAIDGRCIILKGPYLSVRWTGSPMWRNSDDVDIWISPEEYESVCARLESCGYEAASEPRMWASNQIVYTHPRYLPVEIHWAVVPPPYIAPSFEDAWRRSIVTDSFGINGVHVLGDGDLWIMLLLHAHQHYFAIKTVLDLCAGLDVIIPDYDLLNRYGLLKLDSLVRSMLFGVQTGNVGAKTFIRRLFYIWFGGILVRERGGKLVFGREGGVIAAAGVAIKALAMGLFDDPAYALRASIDILLRGPHRIGSILHDVVRPRVAGLYQVPPRYPPGTPVRPRVAGL